jgi:hypothetical protein
MERDEAAERARQLNRELGESGNATDFFIEEEVRPGEWEPMRKREKVSRRERILDFISNFFFGLFT